MSEYIEREALIRDLIDNYSFYPALVKNVIERQHTADVVEVVRCKECTEYRICPISYFHLKSQNGFCSNGKRKDGAKMDGKGGAE